MSLLREAPTAVLVVGAIPLVWSAAVFLLRAALSRGARVDSMRLESTVLGAMLAPVALGALGVTLARLAPDVPLPVLDLPEIAWGGEAWAAGAPAASAAPAATPHPGLWSAAALALIAVWAIGAGVAAVRLLRARVQLDRVTAASAPAPEIGADVRLIDEPVPAYATAGGAVVLPRALVESLPARDLALIIRHERAHIVRRDPQIFWALAWIDALFWPNPLVRRQTERCRLAAELACDAAVVADAPRRRADYARALVAAARTAAEGPRWAPSIFSSHSQGENAMRLTRIMSKAPARKSRLARATAVAAGLLIVPVAALQLAACTTGADGARAARAPDGVTDSARVSPVIGDPETAPNFAMIRALPLERPRTTAPWGERRDPLTGEAAMHHGLDIAAPLDHPAFPHAPIFATADGRVTYAGERGNYGLVVEIDHGGGVKTRSAQMQSYAVATGDQVTAGQQIGVVGSSGRSTGPHLHWELWYDGKVYDPMLALARLGAGGYQPFRDPGPGEGVSGG